MPAIPPSMAPPVPLVAARPGLWCFERGGRVCGGQGARWMPEFLCELACVYGVVTKRRRKQDEWIAYHHHRKAIVAIILCSCAEPSIRIRGLCAMYSWQECTRLGSLPLRLRCAAERGE